MSSDVVPPGDEGKEEPKTLDPTKIDKEAEDQIKKKYGFKKGPPGMAQRKISTTGGKQYFDSGDYNKSNDRKDRQAIASHPHARNPHLAHMRPRGIPHPPQQSKLLPGKPPIVD